MASATWEKIQGNWKQFKGEIQKRWGELTNDDLEKIQGQRDVLAGRIQERYGIAKEEANKQIDEWAKEFKL